MVAGSASFRYPLLLHRVGDGFRESEARNLALKLRKHEIPRRLRRGLGMNRPDEFFIELLGFVLSSRNDALILKGLRQQPKFNLLPPWVRLGPFHTAFSGPFSGTSSNIICYLCVLGSFSKLTVSTRRTLRCKLLVINLLKLWVRSQTLNPPEGTLCSPRRQQ